MSTPNLPSGEKRLLQGGEGKTRCEKLPAEGPSVSISRETEEGTCLPPPMPGRRYRIGGRVPAYAKSIPSSFFAAMLEMVRAELADTQKQLENARAKLAAPFAREAELAKKTARLKELNILLNMEEKDRSLIDAGPEEDMPEPQPDRGYAR